jgi:hypothetical protein
MVSSFGLTPQARQVSAETDAQVMRLVETSDTLAAEQDLQIAHG